VQKQDVFGHFELLTLKSVKPVYDGIVAGYIIRLKRDLLDGRLIDAGQCSDWQDIIRSEGSPLDSSERELSNYVSRYICHVCCRKNLDRISLVKS